VPPEQLAEIRFYLQQKRALGCDAFKAVVEATTDASLLPGLPTAHAEGRKKPEFKCTWPRSLHDSFHRLPNKRRSAHAAHPHQTATLPGAGTGPDTFPS